MMRATALLLLALMVLAAIVAVEHEPANAALPIVQADYQQCVDVRTGPLLKPRGVALYPHNSEVS